MKKLFGFMALSAIMLVGCGGGNTGDNEEGAPPPEDEGVSQEASEENQDAKVEIVDQVAYSFIDESTDQPSLSAFAAVKNTGDMEIDLTETASVDFYAKDGSVIKKVNDPSADPYPRILNPGEIAYIEVSEGIGEVTELGETKINITPNLTVLTPIPLKTDKVKINLDTENYQSPVFNITGVVINDTDEEVKGADMSAGLYDANGKFLAAMQGGVDDVIAPGQSVAFELFNPEFPLDVMKQVKEVKITASYIEEI